MHFNNDKITFSPSDIVRFFESEFASYMDHFEKVASEEKQKELGVHRDPFDPLLDLIRNMGNQHEEDIIQKMEQSTSVLRIEKDNRTEAIQKTLLALKAGENKIYQAAIGNDTLFGYADLLVKEKGHSELGDYYYVPYDFKIARHPKPTALIQLCCYCDILQSIQGVLPPSFVVVTKDKKSHFFKTTSFFYFYQLLKKSFLHYHSCFSKDRIPIPDKMAEHRDWSIFARKRQHVLDDISLVAGLRSSHCTILRRAGINKLSELPYLKKDNSSIKGIPKITLEVLKDQARMQLASVGQDTPKFKVLSHSGERQSLEMLPPASPFDVFFDMEGYPLLGSDGLEYLYGNAVNEDPKYICFWATKEDEEVYAFKKWLKWVYERWQKNPSLHIYHYGHYEPSTIKKLMGKYGAGEEEIDTLLRNKVFVDLHRVVTQGLRVGTFSYSLKEVEQLYYGKRNTCIKSGGQAAFYFFNFLNTSDKKEGSSFLEKIKSYNRDDCFSTKELCKFLWDLQKKEGIKYIASFTKDQEKEYRRSDIKPNGFENSGFKGLAANRKEPKSDEKIIPSGYKESCQEKAQVLLNLVPVQKRTWPLSQMKGEEHLYTAALLAHLLEFHIREDKPGWWDYFSRLDMNEEEMLEDKNTLTLCRWAASQDNKHKIQFEKEQEVGFKEGDKLIVLENTDNIKDTYTVWRLYLIEGFIYLKPNGKNKLPKEKPFTLVPEKNDFYKKNLFQSLLKTAYGFLPEAPYFGLKKCIYDLLLRKAPDLNPKGVVYTSLLEGLPEEEINKQTNTSNTIKTSPHKKPLILNKDNLLKEASHQVLSLNNSLLCIQGPPGSGKTYTAAHVILHLIKNGKRVGVTANSHKAISNVLKMVFEQNNSKWVFQCQKVKNSREGTDEKSFLYPWSVELVKSNEIKSSTQLVGGTTFFFSRAEEESSYDYLFVDEASQVSLANIVAAARATDNIILLGDQNQLDQPIQACHPGESGHSALTYYTDGKTTISDDKGIFLPVSYRMHPSLCRFISDYFYNGELKNHPTTDHQKILLPRSGLEVSRPVKTNTTESPLRASRPAKAEIQTPSLISGLPESGLCFIPVEHSGNVHASIEEAEVISLLYKELLNSKWINRESQIAPITKKDILIVAPYNFQVACIEKVLSIKGARVASVDKFQGQEAPVCILSLAASTIQDAPRGISFLLNKNRLNVALSRARCLSIIVGSKNLTDKNVSSIPNMELMNLWCRIVSRHSVVSR
ncbi:MAG: TM0106 family RecB-like putative nuclease [Bdellovibrionales bacterium]|nr:TM0106 family RecB-like putative nuclease [Bdellovibrionales bacterium]